VWFVVPLHVGGFQCGHRFGVGDSLEIGFHDSGECFDDAFFDPLVEEGQVARAVV
jgi:hypothetical protein